MDLVQAIRDGRASVDWAVLRSEHNGTNLLFSVMRDALKVDGIRYPATAIDMQRVADEFGAMLMTPKVVDLVWLKAGMAGTQFDPVVNHQGIIVANMKPEDVSRLVDEKLEKAGGDKGGVIASVGKYWVLTNKLLTGKFATMVDPKTGKRLPNTQACNYGLHSSTAPYAAVTKGLKLWQSVGSAHNNLHIDPSQVVRLMQRGAWLMRPGKEAVGIDMHTVATDPELAPLISHEGALKVLRQPGVPDPEQIA